MDPSLQQLLDALPDGVALLDLDGRVKLANRVFSQLFEAQALGRTVLEFSRNTEAAAQATAALAGRSGRLELPLPYARRTLALHFAPVAGGAVVTARDVTEARRMEQARRDFVSNASHELRTPVTAITGAAETLLGGALQDLTAAREFVLLISRHAERLSRLTRDLLDLSRIESGEWRAELAPVELNALILTVRELSRVPAEQKKLTLEVDAPAPVVAQADRRALEQVLVNLVDNAVKYTPAGGRIRVSAFLEGALAVISVWNTGPGIERHHLDRLFERFYRADPGRARDAGGTGLGLAIVKHLVQAQHGEVSVESGAEGTRFTVRLPSAA